jgi:hypothetical protein
VIATSLLFELPRGVVGCAAVVLVALGSVAEAADSIYTSIGRADCRPPPEELLRTFSDKDLGVQECPAPENWRLLFVSSHANSWLELRGPDLDWSSEHPIVYERPIGLFPNVGGAYVVEWRRDAHGRPYALIFRVVAQDPANPAQRVSRLFVVRLKENDACVIGRVTTNKAARTLADSPQMCSQPR